MLYCKALIDIRDRFSCLQTREVFQLNYSNQTFLQSELQTATGRIPYNMTNDYMFRVILQKNQFVLKGLIASLLHLEHQNIKNIYITNPIKLGEQIDSKAFVMDIHVILNDDTLLNLEMQLLNTGNWVERSLCYLCRMYDQLQSGDDYAEANTAIHIGFLDFTLFPDYPEFYAHYQMMNTKNYHIFSSKFQLHVLSLNQTELATEEDKRHQIDRWARLFRAKTWEELQMIAQSDKYMSEAAAEIYRMNADEIIKEQCRAREDYYRHERHMKKRLEEAEQRATVAEQEIQAAKQEVQAAKQETQAALQRITELEALLKQATENQK